MGAVVGGLGGLLYHQILEQLVHAGIYEKLAIPCLQGNAIRHAGVRVGVGVVLALDALTIRILRAEGVAIGQDELYIVVTGHEAREQVEAIRVGGSGR